MEGEGDYKLVGRLGAEVRQLRARGRRVEMVYGRLLAAKQTMMDTGIRAQYGERNRGGPDDGGAEPRHDSATASVIGCGFVQVPL